MGPTSPNQNRDGLDEERDEDKAFGLAIPVVMPVSFDAWIRKRASQRREGGLPRTVGSGRR